MILNGIPWVPLTFLIKYSSGAHFFSSDTTLVVVPRPPNGHQTVFARRSSSETHNRKTAETPRIALARRPSIETCMYRLALSNQIAFARRPSSETRDRCSKWCRRTMVPCISKCGKAGFRATAVFQMLQLQYILTFYCRFTISCMRKSAVL